VSGNLAADLGILAALTLGGSNADATRVSHWCRQEWGRPELLPFTVSFNAFLVLFFLLLTSC